MVGPATHAYYVIRGGGYINIPITTAIPDDTAESEQQNLPLATLAPLDLVALIIKTLFLYLKAAYELVQAQT